MRHFKVIQTKEKIAHEWWGMNYPAAQELGVDFPYDENTILVWKGLSPQNRKETIQHEKIEAMIMSKGHNYSYAHMISEKYQSRPISEFEKFFKKLKGN